jgi:Zn-dependent protease
MYNDYDYKPRRQSLLSAAKEFGLKFFTPVSIASFLVSLAIYAYTYDVAVAFGLVVLILIHEAGHALASFYYGAEFGSPIFIPFLGAFVMLDSFRLTGWQRSVVSLAGPVFGGVASLAFALAFMLTGWSFDYFWLLNTALLGFFMNLMNLIPLSGLDGRKICAEVHDECWILGAVLVIGLMYVCKPTIFMQLGPFVIAAFLLGSGYQDPPISASHSDRVTIFGLYILTALLLALGYLGLVHMLYLMAPDS